MALVQNSALQEFLARLGDELFWAQVLIRRVETGYELRHADDRTAAPESLRLLPAGEARAWAQNTASGAFRPLKSAPNLRPGWRMAVSERELESTLNQLYPGAIADWFAAQSPQPPVTHFREYAQRQSGMYRITAMLNDEPAALVIRAGCDIKFCLKRRLWTVPHLDPDAIGEKSLIPCLEPCAVFMEFARKAMRIEQEEKIRFDITPGDAAALKAALNFALARPGAVEREGEISAPDNPRRLKLIQEKLSPVFKLAATTVAE